MTRISEEVLVRVNSIAIGDEVAIERVDFDTWNKVDMSDDEELELTTEEVVEYCNEMIEEYEAEVDMDLDEAILFINF